MGVGGSGDTKPKCKAGVQLELCTFELCSSIEYQILNDDSKIMSVFKSKPSNSPVPTG